MCGVLEHSEATDRGASSSLDAGLSPTSQFSLWETPPRCSSGNQAPPEMEAGGLECPGCCWRRLLPCLPRGHPGCFSAPAQVSRREGAKKLGTKSENEIEVMCVCVRV